MDYLGVDGCPQGWFVIKIDSNGNLRWHLVERLIEITLPIKPYHAFIDMPIGLNRAGSTRKCDVLLRSQLPRLLKSSVFSPPVEEAVFADTYREACEINQRITGKKISKQAWNITPRIRELNRFLECGKQSECWHESHPELFFQRLNNDVALTFKKKQKQGVEERLAILKMCFSSVDVFFYSILQSTLRKHLKADDILDAMVLAIGAYLYYPDGIDYFPDAEIVNYVGLRQQIVAPKKSHS
ncbi:MAG: DUF429 domain-containing protein [Salinivirgaceae bacterium]